MNWFRRLFSRRHIYNDLFTEMAAHLQEKTDALVASGMSHAEATRIARREFGNATLLEERGREVWQWPSLESFFADIRFAFRMLRKSPGFTLVAVLTLALGIGFVTAIFSVVNAALIQSLRYEQPDKLVMIQERIPKFLPRGIPVSAPDIAIMQRENRVFTSVAAFQSELTNLVGVGEPQRILVVRASASLFPTLGISPMLGRTFTPDEDSPGHLVTILSYGLWNQKFGRDASIVGKSIRLDDQAYTVVGVMPSSFEFPPRGMPSYEPAQLWVPIAFPKEVLADIGDNFDNGVIGRLKPGVTLAQARSNMQVIAADIQKTYGPKAASIGIKLETVLTPFRQFVVGPIRTLLYLLLAAVGFLLLIACANVANLLLSRAAGRQKEITLRAALGAGRGRIVRQLLTETVLLAILGGALGLLFAFWGTRILAAAAPDNIPQMQGIGVDHTVMIFALLVSLATGLLFGLAPAVTVSRANLGEALKEGCRAAASGRQALLARNIFVVAQVAIAFVLVAGAGLLVRNFIRVEQSSGGVRPENVVTATIALPLVHYPDARHANVFLQQVFAKMDGAPGVTSVGAATDLPTEGSWNHIFSAEGHPQPSKAALPMCWHTLVRGNYFQTLGIPLIQGRFFNPAEEAGKSNVVIVSAAMAKRYWPDESPIGKRIKWGPEQSSDSWQTIVGVVGDVKQAALDEPAGLHTYAPYLQDCDHGTCGALNIAVRASIPAVAVIHELQSSVQRIDPGEPLTRVRTLTQVLQSSIAPRRFNTFLLVVFASAALFLAAIGVYGVLAYRVTQQTHEIGIRVALGAQQSDVMRLIVASGTKLAFVGVGIGILGALALTRLMASLLYGVSATDPLTFAVVTALLLIVALAACYIPARRAMRVDPMVALRYE
ncbi:MAG: ABC transporter permease [Candidatus Acidiferrales bacterium]